MSKMNQGTDTSQKVLALLSEIVEGWEKLDLLIKAEWKFLMKNDFSRLFQIFKAKKKMAEDIAEAEQALSSLFFSRLKRDSTDKESLSRQILNTLGYKDGSKVLELLKRRNHVKNLVTMSNERVMAWLQERLVFFHELSGILTGANLIEQPTYTNPLKAKKQKRFSASLTGLGSPMYASNAAGKQALSVYANFQKK